MTKTDKPRKKIVSFRLPPDVIDTLDEMADNATTKTNKISRADVVEQAIIALKLGNISTDTLVNKLNATVLRDLGLTGKKLDADDKKKLDVAVAQTLEIHYLAVLIKRLGNNVNQIAHKLNSSDNVSSNDIKYMRALADGFIKSYNELFNCIVKHENEAVINDIVRCWNDDNESPDNTR